MLTSRGWWFLMTVLALTAVGVLRSHSTLALLGFTLLFWFLAGWLLFTIRRILVGRRLQVVRSLQTDRGAVDALWVGQSFDVSVELRVAGPGSLPYVCVADRVPFGLEQTAGEIERDGELRPGRPLRLTYRVCCPAVGRVRFEGLRVRLADLQGFFHHALFLHDVVSYRVLPMMASTAGQSASIKRHNLLPPPGIHRLHRAGSGSELLDLRDYLPGDPPKTIAWKVSARRDRLITKEFESEVPLRCTLFVDASQSVRVGPRGQNALARLVDVASAVAQGNSAKRDLTGLCLFDEERTTWVRPARTAAHLAQLLSRLADAAELAPSAGASRLEPLMRLAYPFAEEVYPELMRPQLNSFPLWLAWIWPFPSYTVRFPSLSDRLYRWLLPLLATYLIFAASVIFLCLFLLAWMLAAAEIPAPLILAILSLAGFGALSLTLFAIPSRFFFPAQRRRYRWRKRLAALLSVRYGLAPGGLAALLEDADLFSRYLQRFLAEHHVPYPLPLYDAKGRYQFAKPQKVEVLSRALLQAVGRGQDNELYVLLADLLELSDHLDILLSAVRVALARHHQVLVICPWPPGVAPPGRTSGATVARSSQRTISHTPTRDHALSPLLRQATAQRFQRAFRQVQRSFARIGVPVVCAFDAEPARLVLDRLDRLRGLGRRR